MLIFQKIRLQYNYINSANVFFANGLKYNFINFLKLKY